MTTNSIIKKILLLSMITLLISCSSSPATAEEKCYKMIKENCTECHYITRVCENLGKKSNRGWKVTVKRMVRYGLVLDKKSQKKITECLIGLKEGDQQLCNE